MNRFRSNVALAMLKCWFNQADVYTGSGFPSLRGAANKCKALGLVHHDRLLAPDSRSLGKLTKNDE